MPQSCDDLSILVPCALPDREFADNRRSGHNAEGPPDARRITIVPYFARRIRFNLVDMRVDTVQAFCR